MQTELLVPCRHLKCTARFSKKNGTLCVGCLDALYCSNNCKQLDKEMHSKLCCFFPTRKACNICGQDVEMGKEITCGNEKSCGCYVYCCQKHKNLHKVTHENVCMSLCDFKITYNKNKPMKSAGDLVLTYTTGCIVHINTAKIGNDNKPAPVLYERIPAPFLIIRKALTEFFLMMSQIDKFVCFWLHGNHPDLLLEYYENNVCKVNANECKTSTIETFLESMRNYASTPFYSIENKKNDSRFTLINGVSVNLIDTILHESVDPLANECVSLFLVNFCPLLTKVLFCGELGPNKDNLLCIKQVWDRAKINEPGSFLEKYAHGKAGGLFENFFVFNEVFRSIIVNKIRISKDAREAIIKMYKEMFYDIKISKIEIPYAIKIIKEKIIIQCLDLSNDDNQGEKTMDDIESTIIDTLTIKRVASVASYNKSYCRVCLRLVDLHSEYNENGKEKMLSCTRCMDAFYCSRKCFNDDLGHRYVCRLIPDENRCKVCFKFCDGEIKCEKCKFFSYCSELHRQVHHHTHKVACHEISIKENYLEQKTKEEKISFYESYTESVRAPTEEYYAPPDYTIALCVMNYYYNKRTPETNSIWMSNYAQCLLIITKKAQVDNPDLYQFYIDELKKLPESGEDNICLGVRLKTIVKCFLLIQRIFAKQKKKDEYLERDLKNCFLFVEKFGVIIMDITETCKLSDPGPKFYPNRHSDRYVESDKNEIEMVNPSERAARTMACLEVVLESSEAKTTYCLFHSLLLFVADNLTDSLIYDSLKSFLILSTMYFWLSWAYIEKEEDKELEEPYVIKSMYENLTTWDDKIMKFYRDRAGRINEDVLSIWRLFIQSKIKFFVPFKNVREIVMDWQKRQKQKQ